MRLPPSRCCTGHRSRASSKGGWRPPSLLDLQAYCFHEEPADWRVLCALGYLGVIAWLAVTIYVYNGNPNEFVVSEVALAVGYGLAGFACWRWIAGSWKEKLDVSVVRGPARVMAAAAVVLAVSPAALAHYSYQEHQFVLGHDGTDSHYRLIMAGDLAMVLGLLMAAAGFWIAASARGAVDEPEQIEAAVA